MVEALRIWRSYIPVNRQCKYYHFLLKGTFYSILLKQLMDFCLVWLLIIIQCKSYDAQPVVARRTICKLHAYRVHVQLNDWLLKVFLFLAYLLFLFWITSFILAIKRRPWHIKAGTFLSIFWELWPKFHPHFSNQS